MTSYRGITWDHPRGRDALRAAAARERSAGSGLEIVWDAHSLEHFESHPIDDLAERYDLIVLDHPHLGEALELGSLRPIDDVVSAAQLERWAGEAVGPSFASYEVAGRQWALPLDAATQVSVRRADLCPAEPGTWDEVEALSRSVPVALSLAGPHAFLTFASMCVAFGSAFDDDVVGTEVLDRMRSIAARAPRDAETQNPIALLERMTDTADIAYVPLVYGYVNYSSPTVRFADAPAAVAGGRLGSTIGGTGLALSRRCEVTPELVHHIEWLMSSEAQVGFIPAHAGQPSARTAWLDDAVNGAAHGFYRSTLATIEDSWVRPRYPGYIRFQADASAIIRDALSGELTIPSALAALRAASPDPSLPVGVAAQHPQKVTEQW
ncbi:extracellular solute-binding protein [Cnuibacter physcomitrellae]|uniref:extracellular solute-binding protein n=1 Tax=Cnuibacter physcomitrellae TaxID=1619308 RepID=UPI0021757006|nr:extracellular solute-binding protein [Cnuibacter physcomitrellae]MCS5495944.1 extracellular solute-binding protein [Cnuibacter physcomitrellae]